MMRNGNIFRSPRSSVAVFYASMVVCLAAIIIVGMPLTAFAADPVFTFTGRGWGHGIGMSQYGAKGYASQGWAYDDILEHYYQDTAVVAQAGVDDLGVTIQLDGLASSLDSYSRSVWNLRPGNATNSLEVRRSISDRTTFFDGWVTFTAVGDTVVVSGVNTTRSFDVPVRVRETGLLTPNLIQVKEQTGNYDKGYIRYRGEMAISAKNGSLQLLNVVPMDEYLWGVVPRESISSWPTEALRSQAVAARSYAYVTTNGGTSRIYTDTRSQAYCGHSQPLNYDEAETNRVSWQMNEVSSTTSAVNDTADELVKYGETIVQTFFHSTSGGHTENIEYVWPSSARPYYQGVPDPYEDSPKSPWGSSDTPILTEAELVARLGSLAPASIDEVRVPTRGVSDRARWVEFMGANGVGTSLSGSTVRTKLGLLDTWFYVTKSHMVEPADTVMYGLPAHFEYSAEPLFTGDAVVSSGFHGGTLSQVASVDVVNGTAAFDLVLEGSSDIELTAGSRGAAGFYSTGRVEVPVSRRLAVLPQLLGDSIKLDGSVVPHTDAGQATFEVRRPGASTWEALATLTVNTGGMVYHTFVPDEGGEWEFRLTHAGDSRFAPGVSSTVSRFFLGDRGLIRLSGNDRFSTALKIADAMGGFPRSGWAVLASGHSEADALAASGLAAAYDAPLLLTRADSVSDDVREWLSDADHGITDVIIIGGTAAVNADVEVELSSMLGGASHVKRVWGADRYATAVAVAREQVARLGGTVGGVVLASGESFADAASASAVTAGRGWPMVFVRVDSLPTVTANYLRDELRPSDGWLLGGELVISSAVESQLRSVVPGLDPRIAGSTRYATSALLAEKYAQVLGTSRMLGIAGGYGIADAIAFGPYIGERDGVLLLADVEGPTLELDGFVRNHVDEIDDVVIAGGALRVSDSAIDHICSVILE